MKPCGVCSLLVPKVGIHACHTALMDTLTANSLSHAQAIYPFGFFKSLLKMHLFLYGTWLYFHASNSK